MKLVSCLVAFRNAGCGFTCHALGRGRRDPAVAGASDKQTTDQGTGLEEEQCRIRFVRHMRSMTNGSRTAMDTDMEARPGEDHGETRSLICG